MKTYHGIVRLGGNINTQVAKDEMTAAEVMVLRYIHGDDAVVNLVGGADADRSPEEERERLELIYRPERVTAVLGVPGAPMPEKLDAATERAIGAASSRMDREVESLVEARLAAILDAESTGEPKTQKVA